jgi:hypothetical protein
MGRSRWGAGGAHPLPAKSALFLAESVLFVEECNFQNIIFPRKRTRSLHKTKIFPRKGTRSLHKTFSSEKNLLGELHTFRNRRLDSSQTVCCSQGYISRSFFQFRDLTYFKRDMRHLKKWLISAQRHQMLSSWPFLRSPSSKMKKSPQALVQILSPGGA